MAMAMPGGCSASRPALGPSTASRHGRPGCSMYRAPRRRTPQLGRRLGIGLAPFYRMPPWFQLRFGVRQAALLLPSLALMSACATTSTSLNEVMKDPGRYRGRHVSVAGMVTYSGSVAGRGLYRIADGEAELWVASESGVPRKGTRVIVAGRIYDAYDVRGLPLPLPSSVANGVILLESSRATE
jgi:hypothetical protein